MEQSQGTFRCGTVIAQYQVAFIQPATHPGDGGNGVVRCAVSLCKDIRLSIGVISPQCQHMVAGGSKCRAIFTLQANHRHGPLYNACLDFRLVRQQERCLNGRFCHGEGVMTALEMFVAQNRTAYNGQVSVGANEIMGEHIQDIEQLFKNGGVDHHGDVLLVEHDAVFVVVAVRGILKCPGFAVYLNRNGM